MRVFRLIDSVGARRAVLQTAVAVLAGALTACAALPRRIDPVFGLPTPLLFAHRGGAAERPESTGLIGAVEALASTPTR